MNGWQHGLALGLLLGLTGCSMVDQRGGHVPTILARPLAKPAESRPAADLFEANPNPGLTQYFPNLSGRTRVAPVAISPNPLAEAAVGTSTPRAPLAAMPEARHPHAKLKGEALRGVPLLPVALSVQAFPDNSLDSGAMAGRDASRAGARLGSRGNGSSRNGLSDGSRSTARVDSRSRLRDRDSDTPAVEIAGTSSHSRDENTHPVRAEVRLKEDRPADAPLESATDRPAEPAPRPRSAAIGSRILDIPAGVLAEAADEATASRPARAAATSENPVSARSDKAPTTASEPAPEPPGPPPLDISSTSGTTTDQATPLEDSVAARSMAAPAADAESVSRADAPPLSNVSPASRSAAAASTDPPARTATTSRPPVRITRLASPYRPEDLPPVEFPSTYSVETDPGRAEAIPLPPEPESLASRLARRLRGRAPNPAVEPARNDQNVRRASATQRRMDYWFNSR